MSIKQALTVGVAGALLIAGVASAGFGGPGRDPAKHLEHRVERLTERLDLNAAQQEQVREILTARMAIAHVQRDETRDSVLAVLNEEQRERFRALRAEREHQRGARAGGPRHHGTRGGRDPEAHLARMTEELGLTQAQQEELRAIFEAQRESRMARRAAILAALDEEQRERLGDLRAERRHGPHSKGRDIEGRLERLTAELELTQAQQDQLRGIFEERRAIMQGHRDKTFEQLSAVLDDEQRERLDSLRERMHQRGR